MVVKPRAAAAGALASTTVLVVDDDHDAVELLVSALQNAGATVLAAHSADEALRLAIERHPQVLVSDIGMPGMDGFALLEQIRATLGADAPDVTVALTAYARERDRQQSITAGFQRHLAKPFDPLALVDVLRDMLATNP
jgi:CheY-like chemotaxis protein